jgi:hypothetical protein
LPRDEIESTKERGEREERERMVKFYSDVNVETTRRGEKDEIR